MKKLLTAMLLALLATLAEAKDIDINKAKGTEQNVIVSLTPTPANMDVDQNVVLTAVFDVELDAKHVQKNNVKLKKVTQTKESMIDGEVAYDVNGNAVTFTPSTLLTHGYYEVEFKSLKATKAHKSEQIKEIKYRFYVPEVINGFKLPFEPDPVLNDATLLGIDSNDNGVRDDVERYIIKTYNHPIEVGILMQSARAYNMVIVDPTKAQEAVIYSDNSLSCQFYWIHENNENFHLNRATNSKMRKELKKLQFNTLKRHMAYKRYNAEFHGKVLTSPEASKDKCEFDENGVLGNLK